MKFKFSVTWSYKKSKGVGLKLNPIDDEGGSKNI